MGRLAAVKRPNVSAKKVTLNVTRIVSATLTCAPIVADANAQRRVNAYATANVDEQIDRAMQASVGVAFPNVKTKQPKLGRKKRSFQRKVAVARRKVNASERANALNLTARAHLNARVTTKNAKIVDQAP